MKIQEPWKKAAPSPALMRVLIIATPCPMTCKQTGGRGVFMKWRIYIQWLLDTELDHIHEGIDEEKFINFELLLHINVKHALYILCCRK